jgi:hypothetical protein
MESAEIKNMWSYISTPPFVFVAPCLIKHRDKCIFTVAYDNGKRKYRRVLNGEVNLSLIKMHSYIFMIS